MIDMNMVLRIRRGDQVYNVFRYFYYVYMRDARLAYNRLQDNTKAQAIKQDTARSSAYNISMVVNLGWCI